MMPIEFVKTDMNEFRAARRAGRARSPEVRELIEAISTLKPGQARAVVAEQGESVKTLRSRVAYAARAVGTRLRLAADEDRLMFSLRSTARAGASGTRREAIERKEAVRSEALAIGRRKGEIQAEDIVESLDPAVLEGVQRPGTMVGAVLRSMPEFQRVGRNRFRFTG